MVDRDPNAATRVELARRLETAQFEHHWAPGDMLFLLKCLPTLLDELHSQRQWINRQIRDRPFCYRCEVLDGAGWGACRCEIAANE